MVTVDTAGYSPDVWPIWSNSSATTGYTTTASSITNVPVWRAWNAGTQYALAGATTVGTTATGEVWRSWVTGTNFDANTGTLTMTMNINATTGVTNNALVWDTWTHRANAIETVRARPFMPARGRVSEEERARQLLLEQQRREREQREREQRATAIEKADKLLVSVLSDVQKQQLKQHDWFLVKGQNGQIYRIRKGRSVNVDLLDKEGKVIETLCAYPTGGVPDGDAMVAQKLMLECDQKDFLRVAIKHPARGPVVPREALQALLN